VSLRQIAERAGVQSAMVAYHYGDKAGLHRAAILAYYDELEVAAQEVLAQMPMPVDALMPVVWRSVYERRNAIKLVMRYVLDEDRLPTGDRLDTMNALVEQFAQGIGVMSGISTEEAKLRLTTLVYAVTRWVLNDEEELMRATGASDISSAHTTVETHLTELVTRLFR
jgi:AcrR family transcriptional regulator